MSVNFDARSAVAYHGVNYDSHHFKSCLFFTRSKCLVFCSFKSESCSTLFKNKRFMLDEMILKNASKVQTLYFKVNYIYFFQDYFHGISIFLHYLFTSSLCCQLNMPAALCAELSWKYCQKEFKAFLISKCVLVL